MKTTKMSIEEQAFAAEHHNLIWGFIKSKKISQSYYDAIVTAYIRSAEKYLREPRLHKKYHFSTIAYRSMNSGLNSEFKRERRHRARYISLDAVKDILPAGVALEEMVEDRLTAKEILESLSPKERRVLHLRINGFRDEEIADKCELSRCELMTLLDGIRLTASGLGYRY